MPSSPRQSPAASATWERQDASCGLDTIPVWQRRLTLTETVVGAQTSGIVGRLLVVEGDQLTTGQTIAVLEHGVAEARVAQAKQAIKTARAQLAQQRVADAEHAL